MRLWLCDQYEKATETGGVRAIQKGPFEGGLAGLTLMKFNQKRGWLGVC